MTDWWWIRHGPTHAKSMVGWSDIKADLSDHETIKKLNEYLPKSADLVSSDLSRTIETANVIQHNRNRIPHEFSLREFNFGDWDGKHWEEISKLDPELSYAYWSTPGDVSPPNGESWNAAAERINECVDKISESNKNSDIVVVAHFGVILTQIQRALKITPLKTMSYKIDNFSVTRIRIYKKKWQVLEINTVL